MAKKTLTVNSATLASTYLLKNFQDDLNANFTELYNAIAPETDVAAVEVTGAVVDWDAGTMQYLEADSEAVELTDDNLPVFPNMKQLVLHVNGITALTTPSYWLPQGTFSASNPNILKLTCAKFTNEPQSFTITLEGTVGHATIDGKALTFVTDLTTTAANFVTANADYFLETYNLVLTSEDEILTFTLAAAEYEEFTPIDITSVAGNLSGSVANTQANVAAVAQVETVTLTGTNGTAKIVVSGLETKYAEFDTDLSTTAANFVTDNEDYYAGEGIVLTSNAADLIFTSATDGTAINAPAVSNKPDINATVVHTTANVTAVKQKETLTLTGSSGMAIITGTGGIMNTAVFDTDLSTTATNFVTAQAADYLAQGVVLTSDGADLIFEASTAGTSFVAPVITTDTGNLSGTVAHTTANRVAVKQVETSTLTGTNGAAVLAIGATEYTLTFDTDLTTTAAGFVTTNAATFLSTHGIVLTSHGEVLDMTANVAGTGFTAPTFTTTADGDLAGSVAHTQANVVAVKQIDTLTLTGTAGQATIDTLDIQFVTSLAATATAFKNTNAAAYLEDGIVLTSNSMELIFTASTAGTGFTSPTITNVPGDLDGTLAEVQTYVAPVVYCEIVN